MSGFEFSSQLGEKSTNLRCLEDTLRSQWSPTEPLTTLTLAGLLLCEGRLIPESGRSRKESRERPRQSENGFKFTTPDLQI